MAQRISGTSWSGSYLRHDVFLWLLTSQRKKEPVRRGVVVCVDILVADVQVLTTELCSARRASAVLVCLVFPSVMMLVRTTVASRGIYSVLLYDALCVYVATAVRSGAQNSR